MPLKPISGLILLAVVACTAAPKAHLAVTDSELPPANCPKLADAQDHASGKQNQPSALLDLDTTRKAPFVSFVIDGRRAAMNIPTDRWNEVPILDHPFDASQIVSITHLSPRDGAQWYKPCPGVMIIVIRTKTGDWGSNSPVQH